MVQLQNQRFHTIFTVPAVVPTLQFAFAAPPGPRVTFHLVIHRHYGDLWGSRHQFKPVRGMATFTFGSV